MTEEQKQALIDWLIEGIELREEYGFNGNLLASMRVALAALTAPPIKAPEFAVHANQPCWPSIAVGMRDDEWKQALRAQDYQVDVE